MSHAADVDGHTVGQRIGYTRVSTVAQTLDQQNDALTKAGVTKTFHDTMSGARDDRPGLCELMSYVRPGDTVVVWKLDRPQHPAHPGDRQGVDRSRRYVDLHHRWDRFLNCGGPHDDWGLGRSG